MLRYIHLLLVTGRLAVLVSTASVAAVNPFLKGTTLAVPPLAGSLILVNTRAARVARVGHVVRTAVREIACSKFARGGRDGDGRSQGRCESGDDDVLDKHVVVCRGLYRDM